MALLTALSSADVDAVVLLSGSFFAGVESAHSAAIELEQMLLSRHPEELFAAEDELDWDEWVEFSAARVKVTGVAKAS